MSILELKQRTQIVLIVNLVLYILSLPTVMSVQNGAGVDRKMYFAIASEAGTQTYTRAFNKTLSNITQSFWSAGGKSNIMTFNITLETLAIELPDNGGFSSNFLERLCVQFEGRHVAAVLVVGNSPAAFTVALVASNSGIPILWARGDSQYTAALTDRDATPFEIHLQPGAREILQALRALFIQTHWHSFTILADDSATSSVLLRKELSSILDSPPLSPSVFYLPHAANAHAIFRRLADISRATRGVVILMSDLLVAKRVLQEAKRLNMVDGHFVWLWIDTGASDITAGGPPPDSANLTAAAAHKPYDAAPDKSSSNNLTKERPKRRTVGTQTSDNSENGNVPQGVINVDTSVLADTPDFAFEHKRTVPRNYHNNYVGKRDWDVLHTFARGNAVLQSLPTSVIYEDLFMLPQGRGVFEKHEYLSNLHSNNLLKNDKVLLLNHPKKRSLESAKFVKNDGFSDKNTIKRNNVEADGNAGLPIGLLAIRALPLKVDRHLVKGAVRLLAATLRTVLAKCPDWLTLAVIAKQRHSSCWEPNGGADGNFSMLFARELKLATRQALAGQKMLQENGVEKVDKSLVSNFEITNLVPEQSPQDFQDMPNIGRLDNILSSSEKLRWCTVGHVTGRSVHLDTIVWPGGDIVVSGLSSRARSVFRVVTALAPPFVMESELDEDGQCLRGLPCHRVLTSDKDNLTLVFNEMETQERLEEEDEENSNANYDYRHEYVNEHSDEFLPFQRYKYRTNCCYGLAMDLLENIAQELEFDFRLYIVADGLFGTQLHKPKREHRDLSGFNKKYLSYRYYQDGIYKNYGKPLDITPEVWESEEFDNTDVQWNGIVGDLVSGAAHMSFAALSVSSLRSEVIDYSAPFFFSGVSFLAAPQQKSEIPLLAFLLPFSPELWIAIFTSLNITAIAVAVYEWLSPFGLNPWGRQRSKNFSMSSALWVMWGLLCGHLVAFKAPKSWPNKFLINVWGGFSVIFVASYTANIAALIAGLFFHNAVSNYHDRSLLSQKVGAPMASAAEYYVQRANRHLWDHMHRFTLKNVEDGVARLKNGSLDILIADTPILDYYRATDHGCKLQKIGDTINEDAYAIGMAKGFPLKVHIQRVQINHGYIVLIVAPQDSISAVIAKYASNGYMDILQEKWYGGLPCFKLATDMAQPRPLGVAAVAGVFILLGVGMAVGCLILLVEHLFYRYTLPILRHKPKGTIWRSRNIMFFSQKLYRFINCVELVSPHHAARELVHTIRQGQITSLFQKSVKRKEHEQRRRRKSKAQFFEMIQEIRRVQQEERDHSTLEAVTELDIEDDLEEESPPEEKRSKLSPNILRRHFMRSNPKIDMHPCATLPKSPSKRLFVKQLFSPRAKMKAKSSSTLNVRRFSTDSVFNSGFNTSTAVGRRLSRDPSFLSTSPPEPNSRRSSYLDVTYVGPRLNSAKSPVLSIENISDCSLSDNPMDMVRKLSDVESIGRKLATLPKYKELSTTKSSLNVDDSLNRRKSDIILSSSDNKFGSNEVFEIEIAKSVHNIPDSSKKELDEIQLNVSKIEKNQNLSDDEIAKRNKQTIHELQNQLRKKSSTSSRSNLQSNNKNPQIRIEIEDTSCAAPPTQKPKRIKQRHRSLGENSQSRQAAVKHQAQSLDSQQPDKTSRSPEQQPVATAKPPKPEPNPKPRHILTRCPEHIDLPPAPPPPNCSPRNSNGKSPLERLSKDELVLLWRSSELELRSHLLKALREKDDLDDPP